MCVCLKVCVCVPANWLKGGLAMGVDYCKKAHNFQMDSLTCTGQWWLRLFLPAMINQQIMAVLGLIAWKNKHFSCNFTNIVLTSFWIINVICFHSYMCHYTSYIIELICVFIYVCNLEIQLIKLCCLLLLPRVHDCAQNTPPGYDYRQARSRN